MKTDNASTDLHTIYSIKYYGYTENENAQAALFQWYETVTAV